MCCVLLDIKIDLTTSLILHYEKPDEIGKNSYGKWHRHILSVCGKHQTVLSLLDIGIRSRDELPRPWLLSLERREMNDDDFVYEWQYMCRRFNEALRLHCRRGSARLLSASYSSTPYARLALRFFLQITAETARVRGIVARLTLSHTTLRRNRNPSSISWTGQLHVSQIS